MKELDDYLKMHDMTVVNIQNRQIVKSLSQFDYFLKKDNYDYLHHTVKYETEKVYTINISESELFSMVMFERHLFNNSTNKHHYNLFNAMMDQKTEEQKLRDKFPAVKKAFEHYSLMLSMAKSETK